MTDMSENGENPRQDYTSTLSLPADAMPQFSLFVVAFFDADGVTRYGIQMKGEAALSNVLGLLEIAKMRMMSDADWE